MSTARVTNLSDIPLAIGGVQIPPSRSIRVQNWQSHEGSENVRAWLAAEAIEVEVLGAAEEVAEVPPKKSGAKSKASVEKKSDDILGADSGDF